MDTKCCGSFATFWDSLKIRAAAFIRAVSAVALLFAFSTACCGCDDVFNEAVTKITEAILENDTVMDLIKQAVQAAGKDLSSEELTEAIRQAIQAAGKDLSSEELTEKVVNNDEVKKVLDRLNIDMERLRGLLRGGS